MSSYSQLQKATHCYVARAACGCAVAVVVDSGDKATGRDVAEFIAKGFTVERISLDDNRAVAYGHRCGKGRLAPDAGLFGKAVPR